MIRENPWLLGYWSQPSLTWLNAKLLVRRRWIRRRAASGVLLLARHNVGIGLRVLISLSVLIWWQRLLNGLALLLCDGLGRALLTFVVAIVRRCLSRVSAHRRRFGHV